MFDKEALRSQLSKYTLFIKKSFRLFKLLSICLRAGKHRHHLAPYFVFFITSLVSLVACLLELVLVLNYSISILMTIDSKFIHLRIWKILSGHVGWKRWSFLEFAYKNRPAVV